jgi:inosose dehydratase
VYPVHRLATTPISWGVVGQRRWGVDLPTERVLDEMRDLGFGATETGVPAFLPADIDAARTLLDEHDLRVVAGPQSFVLHEPSQADAALATARARAAALQALGADVMMTVPKRGDLPGGEALDSQGWRHVFSMFRAIDDVLVEFGLRQALHPHVDSVVETKADMATVLEGCDVGWCFDSAHVASGGMDPVEFARSCPTITHFHLKDVLIDLGEKMVRHEVNFDDAIKHGVFVPLGQGDLPIAEIVAAMSRRDDVWWVLEQDQAVPAVPPAGEGPSRAVSTSIRYLGSLA